MDGVYGIDKRIPGDFERKNILMDYGRILEKFFTVDRQSFNRYLLKPDGTSSSLPQDAADSFHYAQVDNFLLRAQLDSQHPDLPRKIFDIKTRATLAIRMDVDRYNVNTGYALKTEQGEFESFEREYFDMLKSAFIKYNLQVKIGAMDGIFVAYHNTRTLFGFEYIPMEQMDDDLYGNGEFAAYISSHLDNHLKNRRSCSISF